MVVIWRSKDISTITKVRLLKALVWSVAIYGCEGWTLYSKDQKYIDAFEMWCYRRLLRIPWTQHKTNEWILGELDIESHQIGSYEIIEIGLLWTRDTKVRKSGKRINPGMCTRKQKSWSTTQTLDGRHHRMNRADDYWGSKIDWRSRSLERNPMHCQPFIWRKVLNDNDDELKWRLKSTRHF